MPEVLPFTTPIASVGFVVSPDGTRLYSGKEVVDVATNTRLEDLPEDITTGSAFAGASRPGGPAITPDSKFIFFRRSDGHILRIDVTTYDVLDTGIVTGPHVSDLAVSADGTRLLVAEYFRLKVFSMSDFLLETEYPLPDFSGEIGVIAGSSRIAVGGAGNPRNRGGGVTFIDVNARSTVKNTRDLADNLDATSFSVFAASGDASVARLVRNPNGTIQVLTQFYTGVNVFQSSEGRPHNDQTNRIIAIEADNGAPVLDTQLPVVVPSIPEDATNPAGVRVSSLIAGVTDPDAGALKGIAVSGVINTGGKWQYTLDGTNWVDFLGPTRAAARLLPADNLARVRFLPQANFNGETGFWFVAWDQSYGDAGEVVELSFVGATGGTTAFSNAVVRASHSVTPVNDAPVLNTSIPVEVDPIARGTTNPPGVLVSSLLAGVTDPDAGALRGIAVSGVINNGGKWQYTLNGTTWLDFLGPTRSAARLLRADGSTRVRFLPQANFSGTTGFWFIAWDRTQGTAGGTIDLSIPGSTGGASAFSSGVVQASHTVTP